MDSLRQVSIHITSHYAGGARLYASALLSLRERFFLGSSPPSLVILCHVSGCVSPHSRDTLITSPRTKRVVLDSTRRHVLNLCWHFSLMGFWGGVPPSVFFHLLSPTPPLSQVSLQKAYTAGASSPVDHINPSAHDSPPRCHCLVVSLRPHPLARVSHKCLHRRCFGKVSRVCQLYTDN